MEEKGVFLVLMSSLASAFNDMLWFSDIAPLLMPGF